MRNCAAPSPFPWQTSREVNSVTSLRRFHHMNVDVSAVACHSGVRLFKLMSNISLLLGHTREIQAFRLKARKKFCF